MWDELDQILIDEARAGKYETVFHIPLKDRKKFVEKVESIGYSTTRLRNEGEFFSVTVSLTSPLF